MMGQESGLPPSINYIDAERPPTTREIELWRRAERSAYRVNLLSHALKAQFQNIVLTHKFASDHKIMLDEPTLPDLEQRMLIALAEIENLKQQMCAVNKLNLGIRISTGGNDLDIVQPEDITTMGWVIPAAIGAVVVVGIIARWAYLENEVGSITAQYNGILKRSDMALCADPNSQICADWKHDKSTGGYYKRQSIIDSVKSAAGKVGDAVTSGTKIGLSAGLAIAIPLLLWIYAPRRRREG